ncbi:MAG: M23 family metallopeptidase [Candidatus Heimdallarchaeota archaeon]|nr:M23 family metallopeptidase [Candidatus Heimdallarchaeota archaeon]
MKISYCPEKKLIGVKRKLEGQEKYEFDFLLRAVRIINTLNDPVQLIKYVFELKTKGETIKKIVYSKDVIKAKAEDLQGLVQRLTLKQDVEVREIARKHNVQLFLGVKDFWKNENYTLDLLEPGQETGFRLEHFRTLVEKPIDELVFTVVYKQADETKKTSIQIPIIEYKNKKEYIFPLKGTWLVFGNWDDAYNHRSMHSQEFGFDLVQLNDNLQFEQTIEKPNEEFKCYNEDLLAVADGEVVDCFVGIPENPSAIKMISNDEKREIIVKSGFVPLISGNYAIIKHATNEYSFYAHIKNGTLKVKKGDNVSQGQVIGKLGNSGNSTGPHLHFHLMDKPSILTGRGLPCHFTNLKNFAGEKISFIENSFLLVHTE